MHTLPFTVAEANSRQLRKKLQIHIVSAGLKFYCMGFRYTLALWRKVGMTHSHMLIYITTSHRNTELRPAPKAWL
jgi:hypothetical protein